VRLILCFSLAVAALAQNPLPPGLEPTWDMGVVLQEVGKDTARLMPLLDQVTPEKWFPGGSETYAAQLKSAKDQTRAISTEASLLAKNPEKLSAGLQLYFRFEGLEIMIGSLEDATRRYQNVALAQSLTATFAETGANRDRFRSYLIRLAAEREQQFEVMDQEAQRCRAMLLATPPTQRKK